MKKVLQNISAVCILALFLPYIITLFLNGRQGIHTEEKLPDLEYQVLHCLMQEDLSWMADETLELMAVLYRTEHVRTGTAQQMDRRSAWLDRDAYSRLYDAVIHTRGQVIRIAGEYRELPYHMISAGRTRDGVALGEEFSYVMPTECPQDLQAEDYFALAYFQKEELQTALGSTFELSQLQINRDSSDYVTEVICKDAKWSGEEFRELLHLNSSCFRLQETERGIRAAVKGRGHGFGISLYTADRMLRAGDTIQAVLDRFYQDAECITIP